MLPAPTLIKDIVIPESATVLDAVKAIDRGGVQLALVVDADRRLKATVTDGDVRRGLLRGIGLDASVSKVMRLNPATVTVEQGRATALYLMRDRKFHQLPVVNELGQVVGLELIDDAIKKPVNETWVVLMAGGLGARLRPLTDSIPKPMIPVGGRPLLESIIRNLAEQGFRRIFISVNYQRQIIQDHFGDGTKFGAEIFYLVEPERLGTAGALSLLPTRPQKPLLVMNGDLITSVQFDHLLRFHEEQGAEATLCVRQHVTQVPFGVVSINGTKLTRIEEKPQQSCMVNAGIYILEPKTLDYIPRGRQCDMPTVFEAILAGGGNVCVFPIREYWLDIGQMHDLERAETDYGDLFEN
jgi:dTDP-glucose pyrophosphorylase